MTPKSLMDFSRNDAGTLTIAISGNWKIGSDVPPVSVIETQLESFPEIRVITFETANLSEWDSSFLTFLIKTKHLVEKYRKTMVSEGLPSGVCRLLKLAETVPETETSLSSQTNGSLFTKAGEKAIETARGAVEMLSFIGETFLAYVAFFKGRAHFRRKDLMLFIQSCGIEALPIVTLISVLVGLILAFVGAVQLRMFGANIYVANLVGLAMTREMGAMMTAVIMAGRTGAAFAAQLGTMQVNEEIDALKTMGISPVEFLVLPRMTAMVLMLPLMCLYADFMGIFGGAIVGFTMLELPLKVFMNQTFAAVSLNDFYTGIIKCGVFGFLVAISGCLRGLQCGRSSSEVGAAATSAVVTGIVMIVIADAICTFLFTVAGI